MYAYHICLQVNHSHRSLQCHVDTFHHCVKLGQINVLIFVYWAQLTCILNQGFTVSMTIPVAKEFVNPHSDFVSIHTPIAMCWILLCNSSDDVYQHSNQELVLHFIIPVSY